MKAEERRNQLGKEAQRAGNGEFEARSEGVKGNRGAMAQRQYFGSD